VDLTPSPSPKRRGVTRSHKFDFFAKRVHIGGDEGFLPGVGIEVAVCTAMGTEGDVEVKGMVHVG
jgi:hypothetical protein